MNTIMFKKASLATFAIITAAGKYALQVYSNVSDKNLVTDENGENPRYIVTLRAIPADKLPQLKAVFAENEEVPIENTNGLFLTANIWKREGQQTVLPMKGETVEAIIGEVLSREGEPVLRVTDLKVSSAITANKLDLVSFFSEKSEEAEVVAETEVETLQH